MNRPDESAGWTSVNELLGPDPLCPQLPRASNHLTAARLSALGLVSMRSQRFGRRGVQKKAIRDESFCAVESVDFVAKSVNLLYSVDAAI